MSSSKKIPQISLFLPTYNEEEVIAQTIQKANKVLKNTALKYEILVINDGSTDNTAAEVKKLQKTNKNIRLISQKNKGYGGALKAGLYNSNFDLISFIDSDGQFDYSEINKFLLHTKKYDLVIGYRLNRQDNIFRKLNAFIWKLWMWILFGIWFHDTDCGFKVIKKEVLTQIPALVTESALTEAEFLIRATHLKLKIKQVGVHHYPRTTGTATGANFKVIAKAFLESLKLWYLLNFSEND